jgi:SUMO ligase MMS21 Smc5/6 complex component
LKQYLLLKMPKAVIKKFAIDAYGQILVKKPSIVSEEIINYLLDQYDSRYIGISHAMSGLTHPLLNILPAEKHGN